MTISSDRLRSLLVPASLAYLAFPLLLFVGGWLRPLVGIPLCVVLVAGLAGAIRDSRRSAAARPSRSISVRALAGALALVTVFVAAGATAVIADFNGDWAQRFEILLDLAHQEWPVTYQTRAGPIALVYYVAWFLPAAPVFGALGWYAGLAALLAWTTVGFLLAGSWLVLVVRTHPVLAMVVFLSYSAVNIWHGLLSEGASQTLVDVLDGDSFHWQPLMRFMPGFFHFIDANHGIPAWILAGFTLDAADRRDARYPALLVVALALFWSPFVALGLLPLVFVPLLVARGAARERLLAQVGTANLAGALLGLLVFGYFASRFYAYSIPSEFGFTVASLPNGFWPMLEGVETMAFLKTWAIYCSIGFLGIALPVLAVYRPWSQAGPRLPLALAAGSYLLIVMLFRYGHYNDLSFRSTGPALFVLLFLAIDVLPDFRRKPVAVALLSGFLFLGALSALAEMIRSVHRVQRRLDQGFLMVNPPPYDIFTRQLWQLERGIAFNRLPQYLGSTDSPFFTRLAAPSEPRVISRPDEPGR